MSTNIFFQLAWDIPVQPTADGPPAILGVLLLFKENYTPESPSGFWVLISMHKGKEMRGLPVSLPSTEMGCDCRRPLVQLSNSSL